jgi:hypothetical protein
MLDYDMMMLGGVVIRTEVQTEHVHSLSDELVDGVEVIPNVLFSVYT